MVLPRFTSPFRCMRSRFAKHLSYPFWYTTVFPASLPDILGFPIAMAKFIR